MSYKVKHGKISREEPELLVLHMPGEEPQRTADEILLGVRYGKHKFRAAIPGPEFLDAMVQNWRDVIPQLPPVPDMRNETRSFILDWLKTGRHHDTPGIPGHGGALMAAAAVWLIYTSPAIAVLSSSRPKTLTYLITDTPDGNKNWRLVIDGDQFKTATKLTRQ